MEFLVLGPLEVRRNHTAIDLGPPQQRALLALLLVHANETLSTDQLVDGLWGESPPKSAPGALRLYISRLRGVLEPDRGTSAPSVLVTRRPGYSLTVDPDTIDAHRFEATLQAGLGSPTPAHKEKLLSEALGLWRGPAYADLAYGPSITTEIHRLEELRLTATEAHLGARIEQGHHEATIAELEVLIDQHPYREGLRAHLMVALYRSGRQAEALSAYQSIRRLLGEELGIEPSDHLQQLEDRILLHDPALDLPASIGIFASNLPTPVSSFIGRVEEIETLEQLVGEQRLVTLTGPGGVGKTRLALQVATRLREQFPDGVWLVELAQLAEPGLVSLSTAAALEIRGQANEQVVERLAAFLRTRQLLLVMDNCEHVIDATVEMLAVLLAGCPGVHVLTTSREGLRAEGEFIYQVAPLAFPDPAREYGIEEASRFPAIELFAQRAAAVHPGFSLHPDTVEPVMRVCARLDGLPLALELAAARVRSLTVEVIEQRLDDRFRLLAEGRRAAPIQHHTLEAAIAWSYDLASPAEQRLLERLAVFSGGFTLDAAIAMGGDGDIEADSVTELTSSLVDKSLVVADDRTSGTMRYRMLESIRAFGLRALNERPDADLIRSLHADYYRRLAAVADRHLKTPGQAEWMHQLEEEQDNLRAALGWALDSGSTELGLDLAGHLGRFWNIHGDWTEGRQWIRRLLQLPSPPSATCRAVALTRYGALALQQNDFDAAQGLLEEALELHTDADEPEHKAETLNGLAMLALSRGDLPAARRGYEEALRLNQAEGSTDLTPVINLGWLAIEMGDPRGAEALFEEVESSTEELTEEELAWSLLGLGVVSWLDGDLTRAADRFDECARILEELEAKPALVYGVLGQALVALDRDEPAQAADRVRRTAELAQGLGGGERYNVCLDTAVLVLAAEKKLYQAAWLAGATQSLRDRHQWPLFRWFADHVTEVLADVRTQLGPDRFERAWAEGETATIGQALRFVLVET